MLKNQTLYLIQIGDCSLLLDALKKLYKSTRVAMLASFVLCELINFQHLFGSNSFKDFNSLILL